MMEKKMKLQHSKRLYRGYMLGLYEDCVGTMGKKMETTMMGCIV